MEIKRPQRKLKENQSTVYESLKSKPTVSKKYWLNKNLQNQPQRSEK